MRFFADENLERPIIEGLRQQGHDIATVPTEEKGSPDPTVHLEDNIRIKRVA